MMHLVIRNPLTAAPSRCAFCAKPTPAVAGPQLFLADTDDGVCRDCGKKHAPALVALLELARAAERTGRVVRHTVSPPLTALLELARAAENYSSAGQRRHRQAA
jgi:hypothetical protein